MIPGKQKLIRKLKRPKNIRKLRKQPELKSQNADQSQSKRQEAQPIVNKQENNEDQLQLPPIRFLDVPFKEIAQMTSEQRQSLRSQFSNIAPYIFMSQREKSKFFHQKNLKYRKAMETPGNLPARKIQFKRKFEVKVFNQQESPQAVKLKKSKKQKYDPKIHYGQK